MPYPMVVTVSGIVRDVRPDLANAQSPMVVTVAGIDTCCKAVFLIKAEPPTVTTPFGIA